MRMATGHNSEHDSPTLTVKISNDLDFGVSFDWLDFKGVLKTCFVSLMLCLLVYCILAQVNESTMRQSIQANHTGSRHSHCIHGG